MHTELFKHLEKKRYNKVVKESYIFSYFLEREDQIIEVYQNKGDREIRVNIIFKDKFSLFDLSLTTPYERSESLINLLEKFE